MYGAENIVHEKTGDNKSWRSKDKKVAVQENNILLTPIHFSGLSPFVILSYNTTAFEHPFFIYLL